MTLLESKDCFLFIFYGEVATFVRVIKDERKGR
jgi:hypothetical protein